MKKIFLFFLFLSLIIFFTIISYKVIIFFSIKNNANSTFKNNYYIKQVTYELIGIDIKENYFKNNNKLNTRTWVKNVNNEINSVKKKDYINHNLSLIEAETGKFYSEIKNDETIVIENIISPNDSFINLLKKSFLYDIKNINYLNQKCYLIYNSSINNNEFTSYIINAKTGLIIRTQKGSASANIKDQSAQIITDYFYSFDEINDSIFELPDYNNYQELK